MIDINFDGLFTVELLHKFFSDGLCPDFSVTPSNKTISVINGHKLVVKQFYNKLYAGIQSTLGKPFMAVEDGLQMTFYLYLKNPLFFNYTNLPTGFTTNGIYYFTNRNNNAANGKNFLSSAIAAYKNTVSYIPGDLAADTSGLIYNAIRSNNPGNQHGLTDAGYWQKTDNNSYVNKSDILQYQPIISTYSFSAPQAAASISVLGYNDATNDYTLTVLSKAIPFASPVFSFPLDLSALSPGKYSLTVNGIQQWIYINDEINGNKPFAVIDIFNSATPAACNLVNAAQSLLSPVYSIYFLNRATVWRYILPSGKTGSISDNASTYSFASAANNITSTTPIPLSNNLLNFKLTINGIPITPIPCADPQRLATLTQAGDTYACSEIYINY